LVEKNNPNGLNKNIEFAKEGGVVAKIAKEAFEEKMGDKVVTKNNKLNYSYVEDEKGIEG